MRDQAGQHNRSTYSPYRVANCTLNITNLHSRRREPSLVVSSATLDTSSSEDEEC